MASGNIWQLFQDLDVESLATKEKRGLKKSKSSSHIQADKKEKSPTDKGNGKQANDSIEQIAMRKKSASDANPMLARSTTPRHGKTIARAPSMMEAVMAVKLEEAGAKMVEQNPLLKSQSSRGSIYPTSKRTRSVSGESISHLDVVKPGAGSRLSKSPRRESSPWFLAEERVGENKGIRKLFAKPSFSKAKEKGWKFVKKVGEHADKILQGQGSKDSDTTSSSSADEFDSIQGSTSLSIQELNPEQLPKELEKNAVVLLTKPKYSTVHRKMGSTSQSTDLTDLPAVRSKTPPDFVSYPLLINKCKKPDETNGSAEPIGLVEDTTSSVGMTSATEDISAIEDTYFDTVSDILTGTNGGVAMEASTGFAESSRESSIGGRGHVHEPFKVFMTQSNQSLNQGSSASSDEIPMLSLKDLKSLQNIDLPKPGEDPRYVMFLDPACPCHGNQTFIRHLRARRYSYGDKSTSENETVSMDTLNASDYDSPILSSQAYAAKLMRKKTRAKIRGKEKECEGRVGTNKELFKIKWNLFMISVAFLFLFTGFQGLQNLQTSINSQYGLGSLSLAVCYFGLACSSLFLPTYVLNRLGCKFSMILCMCIYGLYMVANFRAEWYSLFPASFLLGAAASCLWTAKCTYLTETGIRYAALNVESPNVVIVRFFGIFFMIVHFGQVFGNLISHLILSAGIEEKLILNEIKENCGQYFVNHLYNERNYTTSNLQRPPQRMISGVIAVYFACAIVATLILAFFVNGLRKDTFEANLAPNYNVSVFKKTISYLRIPKHCFVIPLTIFNGMEQAFIAGEFTRAYVGCCLGVEWIGSVLMAFGVADAVCSLVFGPLIKLFGRMPLFMFGAVVDMLMIFTLLIWEPNAADTAIFFAVATAWGMADGVWNTQINGLWVVLCSQNLDVAFANYRLWESVGFIISFLLTPYASTRTKLYILMACLFIGMIGYGFIEMWQPLQDYVDKMENAGKKVFSQWSMKRTSFRRPKNNEISHNSRNVSFIRV